MSKKINKNHVEPVQISSIYNRENELLYETVFDGEKSFFVTLIHGKPYYYAEVELNYVKYEPALQEALKKGAVILPKAAKPYESVDILLDKVQAFIHKYLDVSPDYEVFASHYILLSWVYDRLNTIPYLRFLGDFSTGKSRALNVIGNLCYKPIRMAGTVTAAPIYRLQGFWHGTLIIDEGDRKKSDESDEITKILNCGFEKNNPVLRCNTDDLNDVEAHDVFGPKVIGSRRSFYDQALESRCLTELMRETSRDDIPTILPPAFYEEQEELRQQLLYFRLAERDKVDLDVVLNVDFGQLVERRLRQAFSGFSILLANKPELLQKFKLFVFEYQRTLIEQREATVDGAIIAFLYEKRDEFDKEIQSSLSSADILEALKEKAGFSEMTPAKVGRKLRALGISTKSVKTDGKVRRGIIWKRSEMERLFRKYISESWTPSATTATTATNATENRKKVAEVANVAEVAGGSPDEEPIDFQVIRHE